MGPLNSLINMPGWADMLIALVIGILFGFSLEQAGFSSSRKLVGMFYGYDTTVIKVFFTAAIVALVGSQLLSYFGLLDLNKVYVNEYYIIPSIAGGIIMGAGFIMGGFCPGTGLSAMSIGKVDAIIYILGGLAGAFLFAETWPLIRNIADGTYRGSTKINEVFGITPGLFSLLLILAAVFMFWLAEKAETRFARPEITDDINK